MLKQWFSSIKKSIFNFLMTNRLHKMNLVDTRMCTFCSNNVKKMSHLFWECPCVTEIWDDFKLRYKTNLKTDIMLDYMYHISIGVEVFNIIIPSSLHWDFSKNHHLQSQLLDPYFIFSLDRIKFILKATLKIKLKYRQILNYTKYTWKSVLNNCIKVVTFLGAVVMSNHPTFCTYSQLTGKFIGIFHDDLASIQAHQPCWTTRRRKLQRRHIWPSWHLGR